MFQNPRTSPRDPTRLGSC